MALAFGSGHIGGGTGVAQITVAGVVGGADQAYVLPCDVRAGTDAITGVAGGGLTWVEQIIQCAGRGNHRVFLYSAAGTPSSDPFTVTIDFSDATGTRSAAVARYSGADVAGTPFAAAAGKNTNGAGGICTGGTDSATPTLDLTSLVDGSILVGAVGPRNIGVSAPDADYTQRALASAGTLGEQLDLYLYDRLLASAGADSLGPTLVGVSDWATAGLVVQPAPAPAGGAGGRRTLLLTGA